MIKIVFWIAVLFEILSLIFAMIKGKSQNTDKLSKNFSNLFFICGAVLVLGIILSVPVNQSLITASIIICILLIIFSAAITAKKIFKGGKADF